MEEELMKQAIINQNIPPKGKIIKRDIEESLKREFSNPFVMLLTGIRRSGKSTLIKILKEGLSHSIYINFDDYKFIGFEYGDFVKLEEALLEIDPKAKVYFFDEIQNIPNWEKFVRTLHDKGKKIIVTGSNANLLTKDYGTKLTGRYIKAELYPFSFREYLRLKDREPIHKDLYLDKKRVEIKRRFKEYIKIGGFPEYIQTKDDRYLKEIYESILYRDIISKYGITKVESIKKLASYLITNTAKEYSLNKLKEIIGVKNTTTVSEYIGFFHESYMVMSVRKFDSSLKKQYLTNKKMYCIDTGLANAVSFRFSEDKGRMLENAVFIELKRRGKEIFYHKDKKECDFLVIDRGKPVEAIQVTWALDYDNKEREIEGLKEAMKKYKIKGTLITYDQEDEVDGIKIVPAWKWMLER